MNAKESLLTEIETIPESLIPEVLNFVQYIKYKHQDKLETAILSESALAKDWLNPEETVTNADFTNGGLNRNSNIRPNRLFTADRGIILYRAGQLK